ncbi:hypothetical protein HYALB_00011822 [Hymenoscyphus albidus]|uniref:RING-type domain-containing protein n=1 Tax=Hymenoscyphus albidus TaxID=595503 RepID=A0A9N9PWH1_9HELO|nr:hypothetical protein HYALB_00011822 [Hymenoscyphus albidus]
MDQVRKLTSRIGALSFQEPSPASAVSPSPSEAYECELCTDTSVDSTLFPPVTRTCNHKPGVCQTCIQAWAKTVIENRQCLTSTCPICPEAMKDTDFQKHCQPDVFERYSDRALLEHLAQDPDFIVPQAKSMTTLEWLNLRDSFVWGAQVRAVSITKFLGTIGKPALNMMRTKKMVKDTPARSDALRNSFDSRTDTDNALHAEPGFREVEVVIISHVEMVSIPSSVLSTRHEDKRTLEMCTDPLIGACRTEFCWACGGEWLFGHTEDCRYRNAFNRLPRLPRLNHDPEENADARRAFLEVNAPPNAIRNPELDAVLRDLNQRRADRRRAREGQAAANDHQLGPIAAETAQWCARLETEIYGIALDPAQKRRQEARDSIQFNVLLNVPTRLTPHTPRVQPGLPELADRQRNAYPQGFTPLLHGPLQRPGEGRAATGFPPNALPIRSRALQELNQAPRRYLWALPRERPVNGEEAILPDGQRRRLPPDYLGRHVPEILESPLTGETPYGRERLEGRLAADRFEDERRERRERRLAADRVTDEQRERRERGFYPPYNTGPPYDATRLGAGGIRIMREQIGTRLDTPYIPPVIPVERARREPYNWMHAVRRAPHAER